tara:strand:+ start:158 stop:460 length:303 start_codon:yes stop_codon:yes gene_type:complete
MSNLHIDDRVELYEFLEQVNYALSLEFKEKWRHKFSETFINLFQERIIKSLKTQKPVKLSSLKSLYVKKHKYDIKIVEEFLDNIDITLYYPLIYRDKSTF